jgi:heme O synthase-like polyprenyltransferase
VVSAFPYLYGLAGEIYLGVALAGIAVMLWLAHRLRRQGTRKAAVHVFLWSLVYLPLLLIVMAIDRRLVFVG